MPSTAAPAYSSATRESPRELLLAATFNAFRSFISYRRALRIIAGDDGSIVGQGDFIAEDSTDGAG